MKTEPALPGVTGGESVNVREVDHGLGRKQEFLATLAERAEEQGVTFKPAANDEATAEDNAGIPDNAIDVPIGKLLLEKLEQTLARFYTTEDPAKREAEEMAAQVVRDTLRDIVAPEAVLFIPPDEFARVQQEIQKLAEDAIKAAQSGQAIGKKHSKKLPLNEEALKQEVMRNPQVKKFRTRHNALFHHPGINDAAPETGIGAVALMDGKNGSIGPEYGRYRAKS